MYTCGLKWHGGKRNLLSVLRPLLSGGKRYLEPFLGAGSVALNLHYDTVIASDANTDLMLVWQHLQEQGDKFAEECAKLFFPYTNTKTCYLRFRDEFNKTTDKQRKAALFVYLNKHGHKGLCRYNLNGDYTTFYGNNAKVSFPGEEFYLTRRRIAKWQLHSQDYKVVLAMAGEGDVVYCDPPYYCKNCDYSKEEFSSVDHLMLASEARAARNRGAKVVISNSAAARNLYGEAKVIDVTTDSRFANCKRQEIVAVF